MAENKKIRLVFHRSTPIMRIAAAAMILVSLAVLLVLRTGLADARQDAAERREQAAQLLRENEKLQEQISELGSVDSVEDIAREELGLVDPDTIILRPGQ